MPRATSGRRSSLAGQRHEWLYLRTVSVRKRTSSVVPGAAVKPNHARVSMTRPVVVAAWRRARSRTWGCHRAPTTSARPRARSGQGRRIWSFTYRSTVAARRALEGTEAGYSPDACSGSGAGEASLRASLRVVTSLNCWMSSVTRGCEAGCVPRWPCARSSSP